MDTLADLHALAQRTRERPDSMPVLFVGHGSPMNGIEDNEFSDQWRKIGEDLPAPDAIIVVSAHWLTRGTRITAMEKPRMIYDFHGFPGELYRVDYPAPGSPGVAADAVAAIRSTAVGLDHEWGLDHGAWTVTRHMYPGAQIPVLQLSIDYDRGPRYHYDLARELASLRKRGVLIMGSGNVVHNLRTLDWRSPAAGHDWAVEMNDTFRKLLTAREDDKLVRYEELGTAAKLAVPTPDHYYPMLYALGLTDKDEEIRIFNDKTVMGSVSMLSFTAGR